MNRSSIDTLLSDIESCDVPQHDLSKMELILQTAKTEFINQGITESERPKEKSPHFLRRIVLSIFNSKPLDHRFTYSFSLVAILAISLSALYSINFGYKAQLTSTLESSPKTDSPYLNNDGNISQDASPMSKPENTEESGAIHMEEIQVQASRQVVSKPKVPTSVLDTDVFTDSAPNELNIENDAASLVGTGESELARDERLTMLGSKKRSESMPVRARLAKPKNADAFQELVTITTTKTTAEPLPVILATGSKNEYPNYDLNSVKLASTEPLSTFSADVDTASYTLVRNQLTNGLLPEQQAVRAEEFINYFNYDYPTPTSKSVPFEPSITVVDSPWNKERKLIHIGVQGYDLPPTSQPDSNIVFLIDVSGSMNQANKLPLAKQAIKLLLNELKPDDHVAIATYAGSARLALRPTLVKNKSKIIQSLTNLRAGGGTAGAAGINIAYDTAQENFSADKINRVILLTDGDFNIGQSSNEALKALVGKKRQSGIFLSVVGFGQGNYQDDMMQSLAQNGNGVAAYIDSIAEAKKVLVDEATSLLFPIAKDVKFQVEFNPATVHDYRLIGYETRALRNQDFNNDKVDAGEIGAGHTVTAIYEVTPTSASQKAIDPLRYGGSKTENKVKDKSREYGFLKIRYKLPDESISKLIEKPIPSASTTGSDDVHFSIAVAGFAQLLNGDLQSQQLSFEQVSSLARKNKGQDENGYRAEFIRLIETAQLLSTVRD